MTSDVAALRERLSHETDGFQRNRIMRALCEVGDEFAAVRLMRELDGSALRRALNRDHFLRRHDPAGWPTARQSFLAQARQAGSGANGQPLLAALDLYTFFDFCVTGGEQIQGADAVLLARRSDDLWNSGEIPVELAARVLSLAAICTTADTTED